MKLMERLLKSILLLISEKNHFYCEKGKQCTNFYKYIFLVCGTRNQLRTKEKLVILEKKQLDLFDSKLETT